jgi:predicted esterase
LGTFWHDSRRKRAGTLVVLAGAAGVMFARIHSHRPSAVIQTSDADAQTEPPLPPPDWCAPGFEPIEGGGCVAASGAVSKPQPVVVYLHGRYARDAAGEEVDRQRRLGARAKARGYVVLALRGVLGGCAAADLSNWFCWPNSERDAGVALGFVDGWARALATAERRAGGSPSRFLLGFSNGGYFASLIAARGLLRLDGIVVAHAGPIEPMRALSGKPPLLLLSADEDVAQDEMIRLDDVLTREKWPHDSYARAGGHDLSDEDIDAALTFFSRAKQGVPLRPPLPLHRPVRHTRTADANGDEDGESTGSAAMPRIDGDGVSNDEHADDEDEEDAGLWHVPR